MPLINITPMVPRGGGCGADVVESPKGGTPPRAIISPLCRSTNGQFPLPALRKRRAFDRRERSVGVGARISFDAAADAVQVEVEGGELEVGREDFTDPSRIKSEQVFTWQA